MKTTIKLTPTKSLTVEPCKAGGILATISFSMFGVTSSEALHLTPDQCGALLFGVEQALGQTDEAKPIFGHQFGA